MVNQENEAKLKSLGTTLYPTEAYREDQDVTGNKVSTVSAQPIKDNSIKLDEIPYLKDPIDLRSIQSNLPSVDLRGSVGTEAGLSSPEDPNLAETEDLKAKDQYPGNIKRTSRNAEDLLLNPNVYLKYEQSIDVTEDFTDILVNQLGHVKHFARNTTVFSLSLGERGIIWTYRKVKTLSKMWFAYVFLLFLLLGYSVIGAVTFQLLEGPEDIKYSNTLYETRKELAVKLEKMVKNETIMRSNPDLFKLIEEDLIAYEGSYAEYSKHINNKENITQTSWTFWKAMVFAGTIYTTIGYGDITPKTPAGRAVTIIYAIIGIPLFLIVLATFGKLLTRILKYFWVYIINFRNRRKTQTPPKVTMNDQKSEGTEEEGTVEMKNPPEPTEIKIDDDFNLPISFAILILVLYMIIGAAVINYLEESWNFFESFYYIFISMSTIGLGDFVSHHPIYMYISILYIIFGLSLTSMCIDVISKKIFSVLTKYEHLLIKEEESPLDKREDEIVNSLNDQIENSPSETQKR